MRKSYRPWTPLQPYLLPPSPTEWLPEGHLAYFILEVVEELDLSAIEDMIAAKDPRGERPYAPRMLLALLLYGYCVGVFSSRKMAQATYEDVAFRVLAGGAHPHFTTVNEFRRVYWEAIARLFVQGLRLCERAGLVKLGHVALDGAKILANASKHKAMSYQRMEEEAARLRAQVEALLKRADEVDQQEDERYGAGVDPWQIPEELKRRETRLARIQAAKAELEREAAEARAAALRELADGQREKAADPTVDEAERSRAATRAAKSEAQADKLDGGDDDGPDGTGTDLPQHRVPVKPDGTPKPEAQRNFTDPDSRIMVKGGAFVQAYNAQVVVDGAAQVIVAQAVTNQPPDPEHLIPLLNRVIDNVGRAPDRMSADTGYYADANVAHCERAEVDAYIAVGRLAHGDAVEPPRPTEEPAPTRKGRMRTKLQSFFGRAIYARRKVIVEPVFGQIQAAQGFRRFSVRGLTKVRNEWSLVCLAHNLLKLFRASSASARELATPA